MTWDSGLNEEQKKAASHIGSHARLIAGPGTGKTFCLTRRILYLIENKHISPSRITVLTFTRAAAAELRNRILQELTDETNIPRISTLHSFSLKLILQNPTRTLLPQPIRIADDFEERYVIMEELKSLLKKRISEIKELFGQLSSDWEKLTFDHERYPNPAFLGAWEEHRSVYGYTLRSELVYQLKHSLEEADFDFISPIDYLLVDEYQDLNPCDLYVVKKITQHNAELFCTGDDDQSIYGFRFANPEGIRRFTTEFNPSTSLELHTCLRCDTNILNLGLFVARQDIRRVEKNLHCCDGAGSGEVRILKFNGQRQEADNIANVCDWLKNIKGIDPQKILILLRSDRNGFFSEVIHQSLTRKNINSNIISDPLASLNTDEGRCFICLLHLLVNRNDHLAWRVILHLRGKGIGEGTFNSIYEIARSARITFSETLARISENPELIHGRGKIVQQEYLEINSILDQVNITSYPSLIDFIVAFANTHINNSQLKEEIISIFRRTIQTSEEQNLEWTLRAINISLSDGEQDLTKNGSIPIMTMHQAKGLTAEAVIIAACEDEQLPGASIGIDDERRLLYVSLTRAKHYLFVTYCQNRTGVQMHSGSNSGNRHRTLTRFLRGGPVVPESGINYVDSLTQVVAPIAK